MVQLSKAIYFPAATVLGTPPAAESVGSDARRVGMLGGHIRVSKRANEGEVEVFGCTAPNTSGERKLEPG